MSDREKNLKILKDLSFRLFGLGFRVDCRSLQGDGSATKAFPDCSGVIDIRGYPLTFNNVIQDQLSRIIGTHYYGHYQGGGLPKGVCLRIYFKW